MNIVQALISGFVQGVTEFFPISSSGHLVLLHAFFKIDTPQLSFDIFLHLGTLFAVLFYFRADIALIFSTKRKTALLLVWSSIPAGIVGFASRNMIEKYFAMPGLVSAMLVLTGVWLIGASLAVRCRACGCPQRPLNLWISFIIGLAQAAAIMPGISRSGTTIATGVALGVEKEEAFRFSFLLSVPAVAGAFLLKLPAAMKGFTVHDIVNFGAGGIAAMATGLVTLGILRSVVKRNELYLFGAYCVAAGCAGWALFR